MILYYIKGLQKAKEASKKDKKPLNQSVITKTKKATLASKKKSQIVDNGDNGESDEIEIINKENQENIPNNVLNQLMNVNPNEVNKDKLARELRNLRAQLEEVLQSIAAARTKERKLIKDISKVSY